LKRKLEVSDGNEYLKYLTKEKSISDQIINHSRSMITIINREYIYEKVNSTFCNAHQVVLDAILGKTLGDVWGHDTFQNVIKRNGLTNENERAITFLVLETNGILFSMILSLL